MTPARTPAEVAQQEAPQSVPPDFTLPSSRNLRALIHDRAPADWKEPLLRDLDSLDVFVRMGLNVRAVLAPAGWTTVTDDPGTWPPETDAPHLGHFGWWLACSNCTVQAGQYLRRHAEFMSRDAQSSPPYFRWMPWPSSAAPADGEVARLRGVLGALLTRGALLRADNETLDLIVDRDAYDAALAAWRAEAERGR